MSSQSLDVVLYQQLHKMCLFNITIKQGARLLLIAAYIRTRCALALCMPPIYLLSLSLSQ